MSIVIKERSILVATLALPSPFRNHSASVFHVILSYIKNSKAIKYSHMLGDCCAQNVKMKMHSDIVMTVNSLCARHAVN